jgi:hypothetical protein
MELIASRGKNAKWYTEREKANWDKKRRFFL